MRAVDVETVPSWPPSPSITNRPFHAAGRLTTKFVSEPGSGEIVPRTRQNAGTVAFAATETAEPTTVPGGTVRSGRSVALQAGVASTGGGALRWTPASHSPNAPITRFRKQVFI